MVTRRPRTRNEERAYGSAHRNRRRVLIGQLEQAGAALCPKCGLPMTADMRLHLDHSDPAAKQAGLPGDQLCHAVCNQADGGRIGMAIMRAQAAGQLPFLPEPRTAPEPERKPPTEAEIAAEMKRIGQDYGHHEGCRCREYIASGGGQSRCWLSPAYLDLGQVR